MKQDEEVWVELQYYGDRKHMDEGLAGVLHDKMSQAPAPNCIVSEITITNPVTRHEGRKGAIFEYPEYAETVVIQD
jgi:hypothetical protein